MLLILVGIFLPWLVFFLLGKTWQGIICLILQLTVLGWIPASIWALIVLYKSQPHSRHSNQTKPKSRKAKK